MSALRDDIVRFLNNYLHIDEFRDYCPNGMQVIGRPEIKRVAFGVSANVECFRLAATGQADMLLVHHGLFWENMSREIGAVMKARLHLLFEHDISLLGYHLPLDAHPEVGNNALWLKHLGFALEGVSWAVIHGKAIGAIGLASTAIDVQELVERIEFLAGASPRVCAYGPQTVHRLGVVTGGGQGYLMDAIAQGCDTFLTGEIGEPTEAIAREAGVNFIAAGHYNSEKMGVQVAESNSTGIPVLSDILRMQFEVETFFCNVPNPV